MKRPAAIALVACSALLILSSNVAAQPLTSSDGESLVAGFPARIDAVADAVQSGTRGLSFEAERLVVPALVATLSDNTAAAALSFMQDEIMLDPYEGTMRGVRGTLFTRAGNSLDQCLLFGAILDELREDWRLVRGDVSDPVATALLAGATSEGYYVGENVPSAAEGYDPATDIRYRNVLTDHWWVQVRIGGEWVDMDPSFPGLLAGEAPGEIVSTYEDGAPSGMRHSVSMSLSYSTSGTDGGRVLSYEGNLDEITYRNLTLSFRESGDGVVPVLQVQDETIEGDTIRTGALERVWIEFFFDHAGTENGIVRELLAEDSSVNHFEAQQKVYSIVLLPGFVGPDYYNGVLASFLGEFAGVASALETVVESELDPARPDQQLGSRFEDELESALGLAMGISSLTFAHLSDQLALEVAATLGVRPFYERPRVLISGAYRYQDQLFYEIDLRQNDIAAIPFVGVPRNAAAAFQAIRGRIDSELEGTILADLTGADTLSTDEVFTSARDVGASLRTIHAGNVSRLSSTEYSSEAQRRLRETVTDLGYVALAPSTNIQLGDVPFLAWWRIEPSTGAMLGVGETGQHGGFSTMTGSAVEYAGQGQSVRIFAMDRILSALDSLVRTSLEVGGFTEDYDDIACSAQCDAWSMARAACNGDRSIDSESLQACLVEAGGGDPFAMASSCEDQMVPFVCGAMIYNAAVQRRVELRGLPSLYAGPWHDVAPLHNSCTCN